MEENGARAVEKGALEAPLVSRLHVERLAFRAPDSEREAASRPEAGSHAKPA